MKKILLILMLASPAFAGYTYERPITISSANVAGNLSNFPVLITTTDVTLSTGAGGHLSNSNGLDMIFTSDQYCQFALSWDTETVNNTGTSSTTVWVKVPSLSTASATAGTFYLCYGNSAVTTYQGNSTQAWDSNYQAVFHLANGVVLSSTESTGNQTTNANNGDTAAAGQIDGAAANGSGNYVVASTSKIVAGDSGWTLSAWVKTTQADDSGGRATYAERGTSGNDIVKLDSLITSFGPYADLTYRDDSGTLTQLPGTHTINDGNWHNSVGVYNGSNLYLYFDGVLEASTTWTGTNTLTNSMQSWIGQDNGSGGTANFIGNIDEVEISNTGRSSYWVQTEYNNQKSPTSFVTIGAETGVPSAPASPTGVTTSGGNWTGWTIQ